MSRSSHIFSTHFICLFLPQWGREGHYNETAGSPLTSSLEDPSPPKSPLHLCISSWFQGCRKRDRAGLEAGNSKRNQESRGPEHPSSGLALLPSGEGACLHPHRAFPAEGKGAAGEGQLIRVPGSPSAHRPPCLSGWGCPSVPLLSLSTSQCLGFFLLFWFLRSIEPSSF